MLFREIVKPINSCKRSWYHVNSVVSPDWATNVDKSSFSHFSRCLSLTAFLLCKWGRRGNSVRAWVWRKRLILVVTKPIFLVSTLWTNWSLSEVGNLKVCWAPLGINFHLIIISSIWGAAVSLVTRGKQLFFLLHLV